MLIERKKNDRILVLGAPGSGKSTLTSKLSMILKIEAIHLDKYYWKPNWVESGSQEWNMILNKLLLKDSWIMDGNYIKSLSDRIKYANHIIYLEIPLYKSLLRIVSRMIKYRNTSRPDMGIECKERLNLQFIKFILWTIKFHYYYKQNIINILSDNKYEVLINNDTIDNWINTNFHTKFTPATTVSS